jgi:hypothetical protein
VPTAPQALRLPSAVPVIGRLAERQGHADIDAEPDKNDWVRAIVDVPGVGGGGVNRLAELDLPVVSYNGGEAPIDKKRFVNAWRRTTGRCESGSSRARSALTLMMPSSLSSSVRSSGASIPVGASRSNRRMTCAARLAVTGSG